MKKILIGLAGLFGVLLIALVVLVLVNLNDPPLREEVKRLIEIKNIASPEQIKSYQYLLGIQVSADSDPSVIGASVYEKMKSDSPVNEEERNSLHKKLKALNLESTNFDCARAFCSSEDMKKDEKEIQNYLTANTVLLERVKKLIALGPYATEIRPNISKIEVSGVRIMNCFRLLRLDQNARLAKGQIEPVAEEIFKTNLFLRSPFGRTASMLEQMIMMTLLKEQRAFYKAALVAHPNLKSKCDAACEDSFVLNAKYDDLVRFELSHEVPSFYSFIAEVAPLDMLGETSLAGESQAQKHSALANNFAKLFFQKNRTINEIYEDLFAASSADCVKATAECVTNESSDSGLSLVNPLGSYVRKLTFARARSYQKLYRRLNEVAAPL